VSRKKPKRIEIVYQDNHLLVLNKPAGLVTLRTDTYQGETLQDWVEESLALFVKERGGVVHRLDKETSGLILVAKNDQTFDFLQSQFKQRMVEKTYWVLVRGKLTGRGGIAVPIGRRSGNRLRFDVVPGGKKAETSYQVLKNLKINGQDYTLVKARPRTGRSHQIRVHFKYLGHPVFGDSLYGGKRERGRPMFLVAKEIRFTHPSGKRIGFKTDLPKLLSGLIKDD